VKALNKLRQADSGTVEFDRGLALDVAMRAVDEAGHYAELEAALAEASEEGAPALVLLRAATREAHADRREVAFRSLGLVFAPDEIYRCHATLEGGDDRRKANALEWLERTLGHALFRRLRPVLEDGATPRPSDELGDTAAVERLVSDPSPWVAAVARRAHAGPTDEGGTTLDVVAKAFLLQKIDLLEGARSSHIGLLAGIAEEVEADPGDDLVMAGEPNDALYVVVRGSAELTGMGDQKLTAEEGTAFGTWSLIDASPSVVGARALEHTRLLRITRSDFQELLSDHPELATGMLQALANRLRSLVA